MGLCEKEGTDRVLLYTAPMRCPPALSQASPGLRASGIGRLYSVPESRGPLSPSAFARVRIRGLFSRRLGRR